MSLIVYTVVLAFDPIALIIAGVTWGLLKNDRMKRWVVAGAIAGGASLIIRGFLGSGGEVLIASIPAGFLSALLIEGVARLIAAVRPKATSS